MKYTKEIVAYAEIDGVLVVISDKFSITLHIPASFTGERLHEWKCNNKDEYEAFKLAHIPDYVINDSLYNRCYDSVQGTSGEDD